MVITKFLSLLMFTFANISAISVYMVLTKKFLDFIKIYNIYSYIYILVLVYICLKSGESQKGTSSRLAR